MDHVRLVYSLGCQRRALREPWPGESALGQTDICTAYVGVNLIQMGRSEWAVRLRCKQDAREIFEIVSEHNKQGDNENNELDTWNQNGRQGAEPDDTVGEELEIGLVRTVAVLVCKPSRFCKAVSPCTIPRP